MNIAARLEALADAGGICVSARVHEDVAARLDLVFEDMGEQILKNIARPVRTYRVLPRRDRARGHDIAGRGFTALALPDKPSIAVLAFTNMSNDTEQEFFADGIAEDIITELSRSRSLFVIARNSSFTYKGTPVCDPRGRSRTRRALRSGRQRAKRPQSGAGDGAVDRSHHRRTCVGRALRP